MCFHSAAGLNGIVIPSVRDFFFWNPFTYATFVKNMREICCSLQGTEAAGDQN